MTKTTALNIILGVLAVGLVSILAFLKLVDDPVATPAPTAAMGAVGSSADATSTTSAATTSTVPSETSSTAATATTSTSTTATTTSSTFPVATTLVPPGERAFTGVLVVNGTSAGERLAPVIERLRGLGYGEVRGVVGAAQAPRTSVYYIDGALALAQRLATDLGFEPGEIAVEPIADAPPVAGVGTAFVMLYLGPGELPEPTSVTEPIGSDAADG